MRLTALLPLISASLVLAKPASELQTVLGDISAYTNAAYGGLLGTIAKGVNHVVQDVEKAIFAETENVEKWIDAFGRENIRQDGLTCELLDVVIDFKSVADDQVFIPDELIRHPAFAEHSLRVTEPTLCDSSVQQYSGYLDITDGKHLFFWSVHAFIIRFLPS